jgi:glycosyltransferase involved in cell wall biosynthesis
VNAPPLAVIIPARNEAQRIGMCLDSVRESLERGGVADAEIIVVDDESSDQTSDVARSHGALALRQSKRQGPLAAWARGVADSSAPLLCFVDADCRVDHDAFAALLSGFARPAVGVVAARSELDRRRTGNSMVERSATFSALMLHETKTRLDNHEFMPIGRLMAVRRAAWQPGDHRWPCDLVVASRAKKAGWEISYRPDAVVYYHPVRTYAELRSDYVRTIVGQGLLGGDLCKPLPRAVMGRAASASMRRQPINAAVWLSFRARLWGERSRGLLPLEEGFARWDRLPDSSVRSSSSGRSNQAAEETTGRLV